MIRRLLRWFRTYRHYHLYQLVGRLAAGLRRGLTLTRPPTPPDDVVGSLHAEASFLHHDPWNSREALREGRVTFLGQTRNMEEPWNWRAASMPLLWRFHLHYFDYLHLLGPRERARLCREWIDSNTPGRGVGWHPYPTSLRIVNWCKLFDESAPGSVHGSLYRQAGYLARNLETYLSGNHLLENARALVLSGLYFGDTGEAPDWLSRGLEIYRQELPVQVLADGGHYERSPMYHAQVLVGCLDVLNALPAEHDLRPLFRGTARRMRRFLRGLVHPDGDVSLFNDATFDGAPTPESVGAYGTSIGDLWTDEGVSRPRLDRYPEAGFYAYRAGPVTLALDAGPIGPDHQPAHGHADIFSYELSVGDRRMVTDSGVYEYQSGEMRTFCRSTEAHNTVEVDGTDQAEVWDSFRVARRFDPFVEEAAELDQEFRFAGRFEGYSELIGDEVVHRRILTCLQDGSGVRVEDRIDGEGSHEVISRIHLHPDVDIRRVSDGLVVRHGEVSMELTASEEIDIGTGWYCPRFGVRRRRDVLALGGRRRLPAEIVYEMSIDSV